MTAELAIRLRRADFNRAIAQADLPAISAILASDVIMITGTDSVIVSGRKLQLAAWKREFTAKQRLVYARTSEKIIVSAVEPIAMEHGRWEGIIDGQARPDCSGTFAAKWRNVQDQWVLMAEIFVTLG